MKNPSLVLSCCSISLSPSFSHSTTNKLKLAAAPAAATSLNPPPFTTTLCVRENSDCFVRSSFTKINPRSLSSIHPSATDEIVEASESESEFVEVGYISGVHGLDGEVRVKAKTDFPQLRFSEPGRRWLRQKLLGKETIQEVELVEGRGYPGKKNWIVKFSNIDEVEQAQQLVGSTILVTEEDKPELEEGEFYTRDLIGMRVILKETGESVGTVVNVFNTGASDLLHVMLNSSLDKPTGTGDPKPEASPSAPAPLVWVPFVEAIVPDVDMHNREMMITPPKGLLELNLRSDERSKKERRQLEWKERKRLQKCLIAAKKKLSEMEQKHVFDGFRHGEKAQGSLLAEQIIGVNSKLLQVALQNIETPSNKWNLSEFITANFTKQMRSTFKMSEGCLFTGVDEKLHGSSKLLKKSSLLKSKGKVATVLVVDGANKQDDGVAETGRTEDNRLQNLVSDVERLVKIEDRQSMPLIFVCPANAIAPLQNLFSTEDHFAFDPEKVWFLEEEKLPVVSSSPLENEKHKILMKSPWEILQMPVGSGGVISLLSSHNILENLSEMGVEYIEVGSIDQRYVGGQSLLGLVSSREADVGITISKDFDNIEEDFHIIFSMKFMKQMIRRIEELHFCAISKPNPHVKKVDKEWVDVIPTSPNSFEFRSSLYSSLKACPSDKVCVMEVTE